MKYISLVLILILLCLSPLPGAAQAQNTPMDNINNAIRTGDVGDIAKYFGSVVDITINTSQSSYSRSQGEMVLRDFFNKNPPRDLELQHTGNSGSGNIIYTISQLSTSTGKYRIYLSLNGKDNTIKEIRIEK